MLLRRFVLFLEHLEGIFSSCAKLEVEFDACMNWCMRTDMRARTKHTFTLQRHNFVVTHTGMLKLTANDTADSNPTPYSKCILYYLLLSSCGHSRNFWITAYIALEQRW